MPKSSAISSRMLCRFVCHDASARAMLIVPVAVPPNPSDTVKVNWSFTLFVLIYWMNMPSFDGVMPRVLVPTLVIERLSPSTSLAPFSRSLTRMLTVSWPATRE